MIKPGRLQLYGLLLGCFWFGAVEARQNINLEITSHLGDKQVFQSGDRLKFLVSLDRKAYLYVIYQMADGRLIQLVPNRNMQNHFYEADIFIPVPDEASGFDFVVAPPFGKESVYAFASNRESDLKGRYLSNGLKLLSISVQEIQTQLESISDQYYGQANFKLITRKAE